MGKVGDVKQWDFILHYLQHPKRYLRKCLAADKAYHFTPAP